MKKFVFALALFLLVCPTMWAGVVIEMEEKNSGSTGDPPTHKMYAQGEMLRMDPHVKGSPDDMSVIFRDDDLEGGMENPALTLGHAVSLLRNACLYVLLPQRMERLINACQQVLARDQ